MTISISNEDGETFLALSNNRMLKSFLILTFIFVLGGCASNAPSKTIFVKDSSGNPIKHATVTPYPIIIGNDQGNFADENGRIEIYDVSGNGRYIISASGYEQKDIEFPSREGELVTLIKSTD